ncbi:hypothetical protein L484_000290 [Morus notabilis]|uniref:Dirigent protein n=1 Tax=Morus notabilis TaxID=981085 RepID=W9T2S7_9ROSA|nr:hypothetical protein L484_007312 [Morus notabilis]EXC54754.1 hypothetical protein L484_000290 [Morus notabilis]
MTLLTEGLETTVQVTGPQLTINSTNFGAVSVIDDPFDGGAGDDLQASGKSSRNLCRGSLRFARGYAEARTYMFNTTSMYAIVEYNVYAFHY